MGFQIHPLPAETFQHLFDLSDEALGQQRARRSTVAEYPGTPCRVSMVEAPLGDAVVLVNYTHQAAHSPYRASHAIFVREGAQTAQIRPNHVPEILRTRLISVRLFDADDMMIDADVVPGSDLSSALAAAFEAEDTAYIHLHYAKPGCFAASVSRVT